MRLKQKTKRRSKPRNALHAWWRRFEYKHTTILVVILVLFVLFLDSALMSAFFESIEELGRVGMVIAGALFVSVFTTAASVVMLFELGTIYPPGEVIFFAAIGSTIGDFIILNLFENNIAHEFKSLLKKAQLHRLVRMLKRKKFRPLFLLAGVAIIGSPIPDEIGLTLMDLSHYSKQKILALCFMANTLGISAIVGAGYISQGAL